MSAADFLGLDDSRIARLLAPVSVEGADAAQPSAPDALHRRFAVAAFSTLVEPGDADALTLLSAVGPTSALRALVERHSATQILDAARRASPLLADRLESRIDDALARWTPRVSQLAVTRALEAAAHLGATLVTRGDALWPSGFSSLGDGEPLALWVRGDAQLLPILARSIALVGARAASGYGEHVAMESAAELSDRGFAITSGGAYGIDGAVHRAALASDQHTVAFLAGGVDRLYPSGHSDLLRRIADNGLLIAELPCGSPPTRWRFLQRNRLIAAASRATVVVEAGARSGSLNTAGHAATMGRPLGAVPGPVTSPASAGCHRLIREYDAVCVTNAAEMAELAGPLGDETEGGTPAPADQEGGGAQHRSSDDVRLLDALSARVSRPVAEIAARSGMSERDVVARLGRLDLEGAVRETPEGWRTKATERRGGAR